MRNKKIISVLLILVMMVSCTVMLSACGSKEEKEPATLETYLNESENGASELEKINDSFSNENFEGKIEVEDNDITMTMTMKQVIEEDYYDAIVESTEKMLDEYQGDFRDAVASLEEESGVKGITMTFVLLNADGTEICKKDLV